MCDTFVNVPSKQEKGNIIFGKNSDREPNEAQSIVRIPAMKHRPGKLNCTYIEIPQVSETNEVILSKPFQMWGAEMGANEHDLVIGNEAVFTKVKMNKKSKGLTGMDMIRLALERTKTADSALELITELITEYGQDANGGYHNNLYYHNSFIISDKTKAWVLETAGKHWVAIRVKGYRTISNRLTIGEEFDLSSIGIEDYAVKNGLLKSGETFHFAKAFSDWFYTYFSKSARRYDKSCSLGNSRSKFDVVDAIEILSSHYVDGAKFNPTRMYNGGSICMHATDYTNPSQTVGSMIAEIRKTEASTYWLTGTSNSCLSLYKPFFMGGNSLNQGEFLEPGAKCDDSFWWHAERFHRQVMTNYQESKSTFNYERIKLQQSLIDDAKNLISQKADITEMDQFSLLTLEQHNRGIIKWQENIGHVRSSLKWYQLIQKKHYRKMNKVVGLHI
ncbi:MAG: C69 family dipeptidase [Bacteroidota bacterium]